MSDVTLTDVRQALKTTLGALDGLSTYDVVEDTIQSPAAVVEPSAGDFAVSMSRGESYDLIVMVLIAAADIESAQVLLDKYVTGRGDLSIRQQILDNPTLGLDGVDSFCSGFTGYNGHPDVTGTKYVGAIMRVTVVIT